MLPAELWKHIALQYTVNRRLSPEVYTVLSLVSRRFIIDTPTLQEYYLRKYASGLNVKYKLPNNKLHSPAYGNLPAVVYHFDKHWYCNGEIHRGGDQPAVILANGDQEWYVHGKRHRDLDLPAMIVADNLYMRWYKNGRLHRDGDLPAILDDTGYQVYYKHGKMHRDGDLPAVLYSYGGQEWYDHGKLHRDNNLPAAIRANGDQEWYVHGIGVKKNVINFQ